MAGSSESPVWGERFRSWCARLSDSLWEKYTQLSINQKFYVNAGLLIFAYSMAYLFSFEDASRGLLWFALIFWVGGIVSDILAVYKKFYEHFLGKAVVLLVIAIGTNFAISYAGQVVNSVVGGDPSKFPHTVAFASILLTPILAVIGFSIFYLISVPILVIVLLLILTGDEKAKVFLFPGYVSQPKSIFARVTVGVQLISFACYGAFIYSWGQSGIKDYDSRVTAASSWFLLNMEMYAKSQCDVDNGQRVAFMDDGKILIGWQDGQGYHFDLQDCRR